MTLQSLEDAVGYVTQDAHMFHDTIRANLLYARPGAERPGDLGRPRGGADRRRWCAALPDGLDTVVGDRGYRLSGGERQRLAIARLLLKAPAIVVLDEATAHLDSESEAAVQRALDAALEGRTSLVIAHRLSTVRNADQILVLDDGRIVQQGTHAEPARARAGSTPTSTAPSSPTDVPAVESGPWTSDLKDRVFIVTGGAPRARPGHRRRPGRRGRPRRPLRALGGVADAAVADARRRRGRRSRRQRRPGHARRG